MQVDERANILIVDDRPENIISLAAIISDLGHNLIKAHSGQEALKYLLTQDFAVILLDVNMPIMDGFETATLIRGRARSQHTPIIFLTATTRSDTDMFKGYALGAVDYIFKPVIPAILRSKVMVFIELYKKTQEIERLRQIEQRERERERVENLEALRRSEEQYRLLFENNPHPMWVYDINTLAFLAVNNMAIQHYGYSREEFLNMTIKDIRPVEDIPELLDAVSKATTEIRLGTIVKHCKKDGSIIDVEITSHSIIFAGTPARFVLATDITEKKILQAQFLRAQRMESIGTLAGGIAHDLNNVLAPILMGLQILSRQLPDDRGQNIVGILEDSARRGADMVKQVLSFARGVEGNYITLQLKHLVCDIEKMLKETLPKNISVETIIFKDLWTITGDATQLYQILMNLCINARDAMPQGGKILVEAENITIDKQYAAMDKTVKPGRFVLITVTDNGIGIPAEVINKIFE
ncbi:MAG: response regulator, partial [Acidobacteriota bacterium]